MAGLLPNLIVPKPCFWHGIPAKFIPNKIFLGFICLLALAACSSGIQTIPGNENLACPGIRFVSHVVSCQSQPAGGWASQCELKGEIENTGSDTIANVIVKVEFGQVLAGVRSQTFNFLGDLTPGKVAEFKNELVYYQRLEQYDIRVECKGASVSYPAIVPTPTVQLSMKDVKFIPDRLNVWTKTGLDAKYVRVLAINPQTPAVLYAGLDAKSMNLDASLYKTTNAGGDWSAAVAGLPLMDVRALAVDPRTPWIIYAGADFGGVYKSTDQGVNWSSVNTGLPDKASVFALAIDPRTPTTIYAGTVGKGVFKSTNSGANWKAINTGLTTGNIQALVLDPKTPAVVYAGGGGAHKSTDGGLSWNAINAGLRTNGVREVFALALDPATPTTLYAGTWDGTTLNGGGIYISPNGGETWSEANNGLNSTIVWSLAVDPRTPATLYAGTTAGVFKSTNSGAQWTAFSEGLPLNFVTALVIDPKNPGIVYAGIWGDGVYVIYQDGGK